MTRVRSAWAGVLLLVGSSAGCRDAGPVAAADGDLLVTIDYTLTSVDSALVASEMLWNGAVIHRDSCTGRGTQSSGVIPGVKTGANTFAIRIANQRASPSRYSATGLITASRAGGTRRTYPIDFSGQLLSTGQLITIALDLTP